MSPTPAARSLGARNRFLVLAGLCGSYFLAEAAAALWVGSLSLFFDGLDFFERAATFALLALTPWWSITRRYAVVAALVLPAMVAMVLLALRWWPRYAEVSIVGTTAWMTVAVGSLAINLVSLIMLRRYRTRRVLGSGRFGYLVVRADFWSSLAALGAGVAVLLLRQRWPDLVGAVLALAVHLTAMTQLIAERRSGPSRGK